MSLLPLASLPFCVHQQFLTSLRDAGESPANSLFLFFSEYPSLQRPLMMTPFLCPPPGKVEILIPPVVFCFIVLPSSLANQYFRLEPRSSEHGLLKFVRHCHNFLPPRLQPISVFSLFRVSFSLGCLYWGLLVVYFVFRCVSFVFFRCLSLVFFPIVLVLFFF